MMHIRLATLDDIDDILALLNKYHINSIRPEDKADGFVTTSMTPGQMESLIVREHGITVAETDRAIGDFAMAACQDFWMEWPLFTHMIGLLPAHSLNGQALSVQNSYQYGPICVDRSLRSTGAFERIFAHSLQSMSARFPIMVTFINQINPRSYAAHTQKVHMTTVGTFAYNQNNHYILAYPTKTERWMP